MEQFNMEDKCLSDSFINLQIPQITNLSKLINSIGKLECLECQTDKYLHFLSSRSAVLITQNNI